MKKLARALSGLVLVLAIAGCAKVDPRAYPDANNLRLIYKAYSEFSEEKGSPPKNLDELNTYFARHGDPQTILRSPADGQPYVILWGRRVFNPEKSGENSVLIAYEKSSTNKQGHPEKGRYALYGDGTVNVILDSEFPNLVKQRP